MERYAEQLLVLAHAYRVPWLKLWCQEAIGSRLTPGTVVDALQLADLCDAPQLHLRCMRLLAKEFRAVERTEAWRFLRDNDPWQELDVLHRLHDADMVRTLPLTEKPCSEKLRSVRSCGTIGAGHACWHLRCLFGRSAGGMMMMPKCNEKMVCLDVSVRRALGDMASMPARSGSGHARHVASVGIKK